MSKYNSDEKKDANTKSVKVGGKDKTLLLDDDETNLKQGTISEVELQEILLKLVSEVMQEIMNTSATQKS